MPTRAEVAERLAGLFEDRGVHVLGQGARYATWEDALAPLPEALFQMPATTPALRLLTLARDLWSRQGDAQMAMAATQALVQLSTDSLGANHPDTLTQVGALGALTQRAGQIQDGAELLERSWEGLRSVVGGRDLRLAVVAGNLGLHYARTQRYAEAEKCLDTALKIRQAEAPKTVALLAGQLGEVRLRQGNIAGGLDALEIAWLGELDTYGEKHPNTLKRMLQLAGALMTAGEFRKAVPLWRTADEVAQASGHAERIAQIGFELGRALLRTHKKEEGIRRVREGLRWTRGASNAGRPHPELANRLTLAGHLELELGRPSDAEGLMREAVDVERRVSGEASAAMARRQATLGRLLAQMGRLDEALGYLESAASLLISTDGPEHPSTQAAVEGTLGLIARKAEQLIASRDKANAAAMLNHALDLGGPVLGFDHKALQVLRNIALHNRLHL